MLNISEKSVRRAAVVRDHGVDARLDELHALPVGVRVVRS